MPRATGRKTSIARYEDTWETINRLIRRGGSWSGFERNCFFVQSDAGEFLNVSAVSGLDVIEDGRGLAVWDFDRDGDPDLLLKSRSSPQVRLWRNDLPTDNARISVVVRGVRSNSQAVGARVTVLASGRRHVQEVRVGSGFLSQSTTRLLFGLGEACVVDELAVRWPTGETQVFKDLPVNRVVTLVEGEGAPVVVAGSAGLPASSSPGSAGGPPASSSPPLPPPPPHESRSLWLLSPLPLPEISLFDAQGRAVRLQSYYGAPLLLNLWSDSCARCVTELAEWQRDRQDVTAASAIAVLAVASGELDAGRVTPETRKAARLAARFDARAAFADPEARLTLGILLEEIARWPREIGLPASLLIDAEGRIEKIYRGPVAWKTIVTDVASIPRTTEQRQRLALPFAGEYYSTNLRRNFFQLGISFAEAGVGLARWAFERTLELRPGEPDALYNLGVIHQTRGEDETAKRLYEETLNHRPDFVNAWVNLGVLQARERNFDDARTSFLEALDVREDHVEARVNLGNVEIELGRPRLALREFHQALEFDPGLVSLRKRIGAVYRRLGDLEQAREAYEEITKIDRGDAEAWSNLGVIYAESGDLKSALSACTRAVEVEPDSASAHYNLGLLYQQSDDPPKAIEHFGRAISLGPRRAAPYLNLAQAHLRQGKTEMARGVLRQLLEVRPEDPAALEMLRALKEQE